jgi:hypothetical protein
LKVILFIVFGIMGLYAYFDLFDFATEQKDKIETISEKATLAEKIKIPSGKEKEYALILDNKNPYNGTQNKVVEAEVVENANTETITNEKQEVMVPKVESKKINIADHVNINVSKIEVVENTLKFNINLKNHSRNNFKDGFQVECIAKNDNKDNVGSILFDVNNNLLKHDSMDIKGVKITLLSNDATGIDCTIN